MRKKELHKQLVERYINGSASTEELQVFFHLLNQGKLDVHLKEATQEATMSTRDAGKSPVLVMFKKRGWYAAAALLLLLLGAATFLWRKPSGPQTAAVITNHFTNDVAPGGNKALLTLADGTSIALDSAVKGRLASQGNTRIIKIAAGKLAYNVTGNNTAAMIYNKLSTPMGGQYEVTLADGTRVWLNAMSSLRFPTAFNGSDRQVELTGEAYFEVAKNKDKPFKINVAGMQVGVTGTHFNVNAYPDELSVKTTLLEGSVTLLKGASTLMLKPNQQGQTDPATNSFILIKNADVDQAVAWKNGYFSFDDANINTVMRQMARWYGVQVHYEGEPTRALFGGEIGRDLSLKQVLTGLSKSKVHFRLEGTTLTVLP